MSVTCNKLPVTFQEALEIIHDKVGNNGTESNPLTTICDYICNTYYAKENRSRIKSLMCST